MTRQCANPSCSNEFTSDNIQRKYCCQECGRHVSRALTNKANRRRVLAAGVQACAVAGMAEMQHNPNVSAAQAAWEYSTIYSQPHPCGVSERN